MTHEHVCTPEICPNTGGYYVTCMDGPSWWYMAGPYQTHTEALAAVDKACRIAADIDGKAWFMAWGTVRAKDDYRKPAKLNQLGAV